MPASAGRALGGLACLLSLAPPEAAAQTLEATRSTVPSAATMRQLRREVVHRPVRFQVAGERFDVMPARFDSTGVVFEDGAVSPVSRWKHGEKLPPEPPASPVPWERIERVDVRRSAALQGAVIGAIVLPLATYALNAHDDPEGWGQAYAIAAIPAGALLGAFFGGMTHTWSPVWRHP